MSANPNYFEEVEKSANAAQALAWSGATPFYVATTLSNSATALSVIKTLEATRAYYCTYAWPLVGVVPREAYPVIATHEMDGVLRCELFICLLPGKLGTASELGAAIASKKRILLYAKSDLEFWECQGAHSNIFGHHPLVTRIVGDDPSHTILQHLRYGDNTSPNYTESD